MIRPSILLRRALQADAAFSGVSAVLLAGASTPLAALLSLPAALLFGSGLFLVGYVLLVGWMSSRDTLARPLVWTVIAGNAFWTVASIALVAGGPIAPNALGYAALILQAVVVGIFAELQFFGLRRSAGAAPAAISRTA
jgi:hypothetical protein